MEVWRLIALYDVLENKIILKSKEIGSLKLIKE
jgi:hypothetical protein